MAFDAVPGDRFRYDGYEIDRTAGQVTCRYSLGGRRFFEQLNFGPGGDWDVAGGRRRRPPGVPAGRGRYYKTAAPPVIDLGDLATTGRGAAVPPRPSTFEGLGEFAYRNGLDLTDLSGRPRPADPAHRSSTRPPGGRPLVPFGGGIDSIVTDRDGPPALPRRRPVHLSRAGDRFEAIDRPAAVTGLPVVRAEREIDPQRRSARPSSASSTATSRSPGSSRPSRCWPPCCTGRDAVVMSNEWSASVGNLIIDGRSVNHQWSKSLAFEPAFRPVLAATFGPGFRVLLPAAGPTPSCGWPSSSPPCPGTTGSFRSCNRAFHIDRAKRLDHWCGHVRQVLLHRPDPGAVPQPGRARRHLRRPRAAGRTPPSRAGSGPCSATGPRPSPSSASATSTSAGRPSAWPPSGRAGPAQPPSRRLAEASWARAGRASTALLRPMGEHCIPDAYAPQNSAGLTSPGAPVGLWGLGVEGRASLRRLQSMGVTPVLVDDRPARPTVDGLAVLATAAGGLAALEHCDVVVKTPGISRYRPEVARLEAAGVAVVGGLGLWMEEADRARVSCVTGTKGKSTTAAIAGHLHRRPRTALPGRRATSGALPYDPEVPGDVDYWVIEVSSFQATDLASSPPVVAVTSLHPDHLDWHGDAEPYYRRQAVGVHPARGPPHGGRRRQRAAAPAPRAARPRGALGRPTPTTRHGRGPAPLGLPGRHNRAQRPDRPGGAGRPGRAGRRRRPRQWPGRGRVRRPGQPAPDRSGRSTASPSSTTACPPTCCRPWPPSTPSPAAGWP